MKEKQIEAIKAALTAAIYVVLCAIFQPISFGPIQFRISEALCLLSIDHKWGLWGVILGCFISNTFFGGLGLADMIFGTLATAIGCGLAYLFSKRRINGYPLLSTIMIVVTNALIIGIELGFLLDTPSLIWLYILQVGLGELVVLLAALPFYKRLSSLIN